MLLDVLIALAPNSALPHLSKSTKSPFDASLSDSARSAAGATMTSAEFTQIKIRLRAIEEQRGEGHRPQKRRRVDANEAGADALGNSVYGKDDLSVRFQFSE
jgi:hypothetical protein